MACNIFFLLKEGLRVTQLAPAPVPVHAHLSGGSFTEADLAEAGVLRHGECPGAFTHSAPSPLQVFRGRLRLQLLTLPPTG